MKVCILEEMFVGGRGLISCEECVSVEVESLDRYLSDSEKWMLKFVAVGKGLS